MKANVPTFISYNSYVSYFRGVITEWDKLANTLDKADLQLIAKREEKGASKSSKEESSKGSSIVQSGCRN